MIFELKENNVKFISYYSYDFWTERE